jgi:hypothetical protein
VLAPVFAAFRLILAFSAVSEAQGSAGDVQVERARAREATASPDEPGLAVRTGQEEGGDGPPDRHLLLSSDSCDAEADDRPLFSVPREQRTLEVDA